MATKRINFTADEFLAAKEKLSERLSERTNPKAILDSLAGKDSQWAPEEQKALDEVTVFVARAHAVGLLLELPVESTLQHTVLTAIELGMLIEQERNNRFNRIVKAELGR